LQNVLAACPRCISMLYVLATSCCFSMLQPACRCCISLLYVRAACPCQCFMSLKCKSGCPCCMSCWMSISFCRNFVSHMLRFPAVFRCCISMLYVHAACHAACLWNVNLHVLAGYLFSFGEIYRWWSTPQLVWRSVGM
jgi:hypothetical protein